MTNLYYELTREYFDNPDNQIKDSEEETRNLEIETAFWVTFSNYKEQQKEIIREIFER